MNKFLTNGFIAAALATQVGCATNRTDNLPHQRVGVKYEVANENVYLTPCEVEDIKARPAAQVTRAEFERRKSSGAYQHAGYVLFPNPSLLERFGAVGGLIVGAVIGHELGGTTGAVVGGAGGAYAGDILAARDKLESLAKESGCEKYLEQHPPTNTYAPNHNLDSGFDTRYRGRAVPRPVISPWLY